MIRRLTPTFERCLLSCRAQTDASRILIIATLLVFSGVLWGPSGAVAAPDEVLGNKGIAYRLFDVVYNEGDPSAAEALFTSDAVIHTANVRLQGPSGCVEYVAMLQADYPGAVFAIEDTIVSGDTVVVRWSLSGIGAEDATASLLFGSDASVDGVALLRIENYLIAELWMR